MTVTSPRPAIRAAFIGAAIIASSVGAWPVTPPSVGAAEPANLLDREIVDVAILRPFDGTARGSRERILTVESSNRAGDGVHRLAVLERNSERWAETGALEIRGGDDPWLLDLSDGVFALIATGAEPMSTVTIVDADAETPVVVGRSTVDLRVTAAGGADVDGDGSIDLVLAGLSDRRRLGVCVGTRLLVLDPSDLGARRSVELLELEFDGAVLGEFDGVPGADLAGFTRCDPPGSIGEGSRLAAVRMFDGRMILDLPLADDPTSSPLAVDLGGDGRHELVTSGFGGLAYVDLARGTSGTWPVESEPMLGFIGTFAYSVEGGTPDLPAAILAMNGREVSVVGPYPGDDSSLPKSVTSGPMSGPVWSRVLATVRDTMARREPVVGLWTDLGTDGCPDLVLPLVIVTCGDPASASYTFRRGPELLGTRPVGTVGTGLFRRLLTAQAASWSADVGLRAPTPLPAWGGGGHGGWRIGPSAPFVLAELSVSDLLYFPTFPVPSPTMEVRATGRPSVVHASGWSGSAYLARIQALNDGDPEPIGTPEFGEFLDGPATALSGPVPGEAARVVRISVPPGHAAGTDTAAASIPLEDVRTQDGQPARRWVVTFVAINAWGEISEPISRVVNRDMSGPTMTVAAPFLTAPWPLTARITGIAEPGATVQVDDGALLTTTSRGAFETRLTLAPWPQDVTFRAVDPTGNETVRTISMVGGLDYRQLPWQLIVALLILAAVMAGTIVEGRRAKARLVAGDRSSITLGAGRQRRPSGRRRRDAAWLTDERDDLPLPEIEEILPSRR